MGIETIKVSRKFEKDYRKLPAAIKDLAEKKEEIFRRNPFDPGLDTHKLHGKDKEAWSFSITRNYRIKFTFLDDNKVFFIEIDTHDIYK